MPSTFVIINVGHRCTLQRFGACSGIVTWLRNKASKNEPSTGWYPLLLLLLLLLLGLLLMFVHCVLHFPVKVEERRVVCRDVDETKHDYGNRKAIYCEKFSVVRSGGNSSKKK
ncbi:hypothetical protein AND_004947 [Anopheles darlingi]|uniref:Uncharacterized protein n=1 Tax=Anopheles darlingi TaxID=43151 RepID=W5JKB7_ANODA|nr:hypothetical protein AND_004947 [Anopheles darlingi]